MLASGVTAMALAVASRLSRMLAELSARTAELHHLATTDLMTGVHNRHSFMQDLYREFVRGRSLSHAARCSSSISISSSRSTMVTVMPLATRRCGLCQRAGMPARDGCARDALGGNSGILLPNTVLDQAEIVAERIRAAVTEIAIETEYGTVRFTTSVGGAER